MDDSTKSLFCQVQPVPVDEKGRAALAAGPLAGASTPLCLNKGGETKFRGGITVDFVRITVWGDALRKMREEFKGQTPEHVRGQPLGFHRAERYGANGQGWVRRFDPVADKPGVGRAFESWEYPGGLSQRELERLRRIFRDVSDFRVTCLDLAWDVVEQNYPRPSFFRENYKALGANAKGDTPHKYIESLIGQTCYIGAPGSDMSWTIYDKGRKYRSEGLNVPEDWVRVEVRIQGKGYLPLLAWQSVVMERKYDTFAGLCQCYFWGPLAKEVFPDGQLNVGAITKRPPEAVAKVVAMLKAYGPTLVKLRERKLLDELLGVLPPSSRTSQYRADRLASQIAAVGDLDFLGLVSSVLSLEPATTEIL